MHFSRGVRRERILYRRRPPMQRDHQPHPVLQAAKLRVGRHLPRRGETLLQPALRAPVQLPERVYLECQRRAMRGDSPTLFHIGSGKLRQTTGVHPHRILQRSSDNL